MSERGLTIRFVEAMFRAWRARARRPGGCSPGWTRLSATGSPWALPVRPSAGPPSWPRRPRPSPAGRPVTRRAPVRRFWPARDGCRRSRRPVSNGAAMHVLDYEPMWNPANHAVSTVLPGLARPVRDLGTRDGRRSTRDRLRHRHRRASAAAARLAAVRTGRSRVPSAQVSWGPIGAAVASAVLLRLDADTVVHAVGIAASRAGGVLANVGSMTKALHCGGAAADGLEAALLAARGFTADRDALDGPRGFLNAFFGSDNRSRCPDRGPDACGDGPGPGLSSSTPASTARISSSRPRLSSMRPSAGAT